MLPNYTHWKFWSMYIGLNVATHKQTKQEVEAIARGSCVCLVRSMWMWLLCSSSTKHVSTPQTSGPSRHSTRPPRKAGPNSALSYWPTGLTPPFETRKANHRWTSSWYPPTPISPSTYQKRALGLVAPLESPPDCHVFCHWLAKYTFKSLNSKTNAV